MCQRRRPPSDAAKIHGETTVSQLQRFLLALAIIAVDAVLFVVPFAALFLAYVIVVNPKWFRDFLNGLDAPEA